MLYPKPVNFNPRGPCGPRQMFSMSSAETSKFQSSRSLRTATPSPRCRQWAACKFQSSRSLRTATTHLDGGHDAVGIEFQSSRSLRTATGEIESTVKGNMKFQSSRSLRTATPYIWDRAFDLRISILAVLADRDTPAHTGHCLAEEFQSSRSWRTATLLTKKLETVQKNFNPRGPCGPRRGMNVKNTFEAVQFQSSRSLRTATPVQLQAQLLVGGISILAVLADRDG